MHLTAKEVSSVRLATDALAVLPAPRMGGLKVHSYRKLQEPPSEPQEPPTLALSTLNGMDRLAHLSIKSCALGGDTETLGQLTACSPST